MGCSTVLCCRSVRLSREFFKCLYGSLKNECNATASAVYTDYYFRWEKRFLSGCEISECKNSLHVFDRPTLLYFYRAMLCIRGSTHGPVSVRLSVTSRCSIETAERIELVCGK